MARCPDYDKSALSSADIIANPSASFGSLLERARLLAELDARGIALDTTVEDPARPVRREVGGALHRFLGYHLPGYRLPTALDLLRAGKEQRG